LTLMLLAREKSPIDGQGVHEAADRADVGDAE
jgi:hypothetical protein